MSLRTGCPRCAAPVARLRVGDPAGGGWACPEHGEVPLLRRASEASYDEFATHLRLSPDHPTWLPWPLSPGWRVTDFAVVGGPGDVHATMTCCSGTSALDGPVDVVVVAERAGTGLGARLAGSADADPAPDLGEAPAVRVRAGSQAVALWAVSTSDLAEEWDRSVVAGEADGHWLWLVVRPASALLLLRDDWILRDVSGLGPPLVELPFGGRAPGW